MQWQVAGDGSNSFTPASYVGQTPVQFLAPGFGLVQLQLLIWTVNQQMEEISLPFSVIPPLK